jgi:hypothetical protein
MRTDPAGFLRLFRRALTGAGVVAPPLPDDGPRKLKLSLKKARTATHSGGSYRNDHRHRLRPGHPHRLAVEKLVVAKSAVHADNCRIGTIEAEQSSLLLTACRISGKRPLELDLTLADLAGCTFTGTRPVMKTCARASWSSRSAGPGRTAHGAGCMRRSRLRREPENCEEYGGLIRQQYFSLTTRIDPGLIRNPRPFSSCRKEPTHTPG